MCIHKTVNCYKKNTKQDPFFNVRMKRTHPEERNLVESQKT